MKARLRGSFAGVIGVGAWFLSHNFFLTLRIWGQANKVKRKEGRLEGNIASSPVRQLNALDANGRQWIPENRVTKKAGRPWQTIFEPEQLLKFRLRPSGQTPRAPLEGETSGFRILASLSMGEHSDEEA